MVNEVKNDKKTDEATPVTDASLDTNVQAAAQVAEIDEQFDAVDPAEQTTIDIADADKKVEASKEAVQPSVHEEIAAVGVEAVDSGTHEEDLHAAAADVNGVVTGEKTPTKNLGQTPVEFNPPKPNTEEPRVVLYGSAGDAIIKLQNPKGNKTDGSTWNKLSLKVNGLRKWILGGHSVNEPIRLIEDGDQTHVVAKNEPTPLNPAPAAAAPETKAA